jgi:hypothetical protein
VLRLRAHASQSQHGHHREDEPSLTPRCPPVDAHAFLAVGAGAGFQSGIAKTQAGGQGGAQPLE